MNLQENIRRILKEIDEDRVQIRLGRSADRHFGKVQNIIIQVDDNDITSQDDEPGLGKMNIVIKDNEIIVGDIFIPEKYRRQGIATTVYQKISDHFGLPIVSSKTKGFNQTMEGGYIWKDREKFEPKNLQENIRRILREETNSKEISSYLDITPFYKLPYSYQKSLMIMRNEGTTTDVEIKDLIDDELQTSRKRKMFYYGVVPIKLIEDEVTERLEWDSFENYHKWYGDEQTDHGDSVLPIIIDFDDEELIIDGWHRFHSYVRKGLNKVPVLGFYQD